MNHEMFYWAPQKKLGRGWICFKSSPSPPPAPDYTGAAKETAAGNLEAARYATTANRVDTYTPYGDLKYTQDPNNPDKWTSSVSLSPDGQSLLDQQNKTSRGLGNLQDSAAARVGGMMGAPAPNAYDPTRSTNNAAELINSRLLPQQKIDREAMDAQLANQGIMPGSQAYDRSQDQLARTQNDAKMQSQLQAITMGQSQQQQEYAQQVANRNMPMNELNAIRTGSQVTNPTFQQSPMQGTTGGPDMMGAANGTNTYNMGLYNAQTAQGNSQMQMMGQMAAAAAAAY